MDALTFLKERSRMCDTYRGKGDRCKGCPLEKEVDDVCSVWCFKNPEKAIAAVEQWITEHPRKTRQSEFLKQWPYITMRCDGMPDLNPCDLDGRLHDICTHDCLACRRAFWKQEVE